MLREYQPCLPVRVMKAPTGERWVTEIKHDGYRLIARRVGKVVRLYTKNGYDWAERYPLIVEAIARLRVSSVVFDGEAMCFGQKGEHDFDALWNRCNDHIARLCAFDLLEARARGNSLQAYRSAISGGSVKDLAEAQEQETSGDTAGQGSLRAGVGTKRRSPNLFHTRLRL